MAIGKNMTNYQLRSWKRCESIGLLPLGTDISVKMKWNVMTCKHFLYHCPFMWGINWLHLDSQDTKDQLWLFPCCQVWISFWTKMDWIVKEDKLYYPNVDLAALVVTSLISIGLVRYPDVWLVLSAGNDSVAVDFGDFHCKLLFRQLQLCFRSRVGITKALFIDFSVGLFLCCKSTQIARFMWPPWGPPGSCRPQMGPMLAPWILLSGYLVDVDELCSYLSDVTTINLQWHLKQHCSNTCLICLWYSP